MPRNYFNDDKDVVRENVLLQMGTGRQIGDGWEMYCIQCGVHYSESVCPLCGEHAREVIDKTHPGFDITCQRCGSPVVYVESSVGFSAESGGWGEVELVCFNCGQRISIFKVY